MRISDWSSDVCSSDLALFGLAGRLLAQKMNDELLSKLNRQLDAMEAAAAQSDFETYYPLNLEFHRTIVESAGSKTLFAEYLRFVKKMHLFRAKSLVQGGGLDRKRTRLNSSH